MRNPFIETALFIEFSGGMSEDHESLTAFEGKFKMASRRQEREIGTAGRKLTAWVIVVLITAWASHDPHQALAVVHAAGTAIGNAANHSKSGH